MKELIFTTKLKFSGEVSEDLELAILKQVQSLFVYGADCDLIMPDDSDAQLTLLVLSNDKHLLIKELV